MVTNMTVKL